MSNGLYVDDNDNDDDFMQIDESSPKQPYAPTDQYMGTSKAVVHARPGDVRAFNNAASPNIINKGHMVIHFHTYKHPPSAKSVPVVVPEKRERDIDHYTQAPNALMTTDQPQTDDVSSTRPSTRARSEKSTGGTEEDDIALEEINDELKTA